MRKILKYLKPYWLTVLAVIVLVFAESISQLFLPNLMAQIVDIGIVNSDFNFIWKTGGLMLLITLIEISITIAIAYLASKVSIQVGNSLRSQLFNHTTDFALYEIDKIGTSSSITRITNDVMQVQNIVFIILRMILMAPIMCVGGIFMAIKTDLYLSRVLIISLPLLIVTIIIVAKVAMPLFSKMQLKIDRVNQVMREKLIGLRVIRAFNKGSYEEKRFDVENKDLEQISIKVQKIMAILLPIIMLIMNLTTVGIVWLSSYRINIGAMQVGSITAFIEYSTLILMSLTMMAMIFVMLPRAITCAKRIDEVLDTPISIKDSDSNFKIEKGEIEFKNVAAKYYGSNNNAIENISFKVKPGTITAIVGGTGSGKSTIVNLLMRFYEATEGEILIDGVNVKDIKQQELRKNIGYVPQKAVLFSGSIKENIKFGKEDASDEEVLKALETAQAMEFVEKMPKGIDEYIAQGGTNVSGGQKQRISIARAIIKNAKIYIFDDSFSALDYKTDLALRKALMPTFANATVIIVAQRISTIKNADNILMLEDGQIIGSGTHEELMETCLEYREVANSQMEKGVSIDG